MPQKIHARKKIMNERAHTRLPESKERTSAVLVEVTTQVELDAPISHVQVEGMFI